MQANVERAPRPTHAARGDNRKLYKRDRDAARRNAHARKRGWLNA